MVNAAWGGIRKMVESIIGSGRLNARFQRSEQCRLLLNGQKAACKHQRHTGGRCFIITARSRPSSTQTARPNRNRRRVLVPRAGRNPRFCRAPAI